MIVGGGGRRGVVATCCYVARTFGVRSAMPTGRALRLCPQAIVLPPDMAKYARVSRDIRERMQKLTPLVEPLSIDEAFLDLTGCEGVNGAPAALALARFAREVEREIGVTVSVGLSYCKFLAKLASDLDKPRGFSVIGRAEARAVLAPMSVGRLWGVGKVAEARLGATGLEDDRRLAGARRKDGGGTARRRRPTAVAVGAGDRRAPRDAGSRDQEHFERDDFRDRRRRPRRADPRRCSPIAIGWRRGCARAAWRRGR